LFVANLVVVSRKGV